jgi:hypothetical protein
MNQHSALVTLRFEIESKIGEDILFCPIEYVNESIESKDDYLLRIMYNNIVYHYVCPIQDITVIIIVVMVDFISNLLSEDDFNKDCNLIINNLFVGLVKKQDDVHMGILFTEYIGSIDLSIFESEPVVMSSPKSLDAIELENSCQ